MKKHIKRYNKNIIQHIQDLFLGKDKFGSGDGAGYRSGSGKGFNDATGYGFGNGRGYGDECSNGNANVFANDLTNVFGNESGCWYGKGDEFGCGYA